MEEVKGVYHHFFTLDHRCVFKTRKSDIVLKIFTVFNTLIFKSSFSKDHAHSLSSLKDCIPHEYIPSFPTLENCLKEVEDLKKEISEERVESWSLIRTGEESLADPRVFLVLNLNIVLSHLNSNRVDQAIEVLKKIAYDDPKIGRLFIKLHVLENRQEECLVFISELIERNPGWARDLYRYVLKWIPTHWIFYTELVSLIQDSVQKAHVFAAASVSALQTAHYKSAQTFLIEAQKIHPHFFPYDLIELEIMAKEGRDDEVVSKLHQLIALYEKLKDFKSLIKACKKLIFLKYCPLICQKIITNYNCLKLNEKVLKWWQILVDKGEVLQDELQAELAQSLVENDSLTAPYELWDFLGIGLLKNARFRLAAAVFTKALKARENCDLAELLAKRFEEAGDKRECVWFYGEAFRLSLKDFLKASSYLSKIESLNPSRLYLDLLQERVAILHKQAVSLRAELQKPSKIAAPRHIEALLSKSSHELIFIPAGLSLARLSKLPNVTIDCNVHDTSIERGYWMVITSSLLKCTSGLHKGERERILKEAGQKVGLTYQQPTIIELLWWLLTQNYGQLTTGCSALVAHTGELITTYGNGRISVTTFPILMGTIAVHRFTS